MQVVEFTKWYMWKLQTKMLRNQISSQKCCQKATQCAIEIALLPQMLLLIVNWKSFKSTSCWGGRWSWLFVMFSDGFLSLMGWRFTVSLLVNRSNKATARALDKNNPKNIFKREWVLFWFGRVSIANVFSLMIFYTNQRETRV